MSSKFCESHAPVLFYVHYTLNERVKSGSTNQGGSDDKCVYCDRVVYCGRV